MLRFILGKTKWWREEVWRNLTGCKDLIPHSLLLPFLLPRLTNSFDWRTLKPPEVGKEKNPSLVDPWSTKRRPPPPFLPFSDPTTPPPHLSHSVQLCGVGDTGAQYCLLLLFYPQRERERNMGTSFGLNKLLVSLKTVAVLWIGMNKKKKKSLPKREETIEVK